MKRLVITVEGSHTTGKTTVAGLIAMMLSRLHMQVSVEDEGIVVSSRQSESPDSPWPSYTRMVSINERYLNDLMRANPAEPLGEVLIRTKENQSMPSDYPPQSALPRKPTPGKGN